MKFVGCTVFALITMLLAISGFAMKGRFIRTLGSTIKSTNNYSLHLNVHAASLSSLSEKAKVTHPSFDRVEDFQIKEYGFSGSLFRHKKTGAEIISIVTPDDNKVFGITFRTPPADHTGLPHILEHSVLCGSRKYPVKEPFVHMLRSSLQNFLNAFTYPDRTCYPIASTNLKDFYNLVSVYLDGVFYPRAISDPNVLAQEGWHYELDKASDDLSIKGVVYNEMKGVYSSPESLLSRATQHGLFNDKNHPYSFDSGGDPNYIPTLTFQQFQEFHRLFYHPSNSKIFFYGDDDPYERLVLLEAYLQHFESISTKHSEVPFQKLVSSGLNDLGKIQLPYPITPGQPLKHMTTVNWILNERAWTPTESLAIDVLDYLLLGTTTAELHKTLVESNLGESLIGGGLSDELVQTTFSLGMKGVDKENVAKLEELVIATIERLAKEGFPQNAIDAAINTIEFKLREFNTGGYPKGLSLMLGMNKPWLYGRHPVDGIAFEKPLAELKQDLKDGKPIFQDMLQKYFVANKHRLIVEMIPDPELEQKQSTTEKQTLATKKATFAEKSIEDIITKTKTLREIQEKEDSQEAKATLPRLSLADINREIKKIPITIVQDTLQSPTLPATILNHGIQTNGIYYVDIAFDYSDVSLEDLEYLPLFAKLLMESPTKNYDETTLQRTIGTHTGGISLAYHNDLIGDLGQVTDTDNALLYFMIRGKVASSEKLPILFDLFHEILYTANLDNPKKAIIKLRESKSYKESALLTSGHSYAASRIAGRDSFLGYVGEMQGGLESVRRANVLLAEAENNWPAVKERLERIRSKILLKRSDQTASSKRRVVINLTANEELLTEANAVANSFMEKIPSASAPTTTTEGILSQWKVKKQDLLLPKRHEGFTIPSLVNYVGYGGKVYHQGEKVSGSTAVVSKYLSTAYLWDQVRVLGGAYGAFVRFSDASGRVIYLSYRDPNLLSTLDAYKNSVKFLNENELSSDEITELVIGTIGDLDAPQSPDQQGFSSFASFLSGETEEQRQIWRNEVLATKCDDFKAFAKRLELLRETGQIVVFGSQESIEISNKELFPENKMIIEQAMSSMTASVSVDGDSHQQ